MSFPTYDPELDREILAKQPLNQLSAICSTNSYLNNICLSNEFWLLKLEEFNPEDYLDVLVTQTPKDTYLQMVQGQQALDRFYQIVKLSLVEMNMDAIIIYSDFGDSSFKISNQGQGGQILDLSCRQEDQTPGALAEVTSGDIQLNLQTRKITGEMSIVGFPDERWPASRIITHFFLSENLY